MNRTPRQIDWVSPRVRTRRHYNPDYAHLDPAEYPDNRFRVLTTTSTFGDGPDSPYMLRQRVKFQHDVTVGEAQRLLADHYMRGCSCEHDCCGHYSGGLRRVEAPRNRKRGEFIVTATYNPNV